MRALNESFEGVFAALHRQSVRVRGGGRALMLIAARRREGVADAARLVAERAFGAVYALDLDLHRNALARAFSESAPLGPKQSGRFGDLSFYTLIDRNGRPMPEPTPIFSYRRVGQTALRVGAVDVSLAPKGARIAVSDRPDYWNAARQACDIVVIDAPALEHSRVGLRIARHMDGVVMIVDAEAGSAPAALAARDAIVSAGGNLIGLIYANASAPLMTIDRVLRQAG